MSKREMTVEYLTEMVKKSFANVDIDDKGKMCVLPYQSLVDTIDLYENKLAKQQAEIERLKDENIEQRDIHFKNLCEYKDEIARLEKQVDELKTENKELYKEHTTLIAGSILKQQDIVKDTAKEICKAIHEELQANLFELKHFIFDTERQQAQQQQNIGIIAAQDAVSRFEKKIKERYGVEVE